QRVGTALLLTFPIEFLLTRDNVHRRRRRISAEAMGDRESGAGDNGRRPLENETEAKLLQEWHDPSLASDRGRTFLAACHPSVEGVPVYQRLGECLLDFVAKSGIEAKVNRTLARHILRRSGDLLDRIAGN